VQWRIFAIKQVKMADYQELVCIFSTWIVTAMVFGVIEAQTFHDHPFLSLSFPRIHYLFTAIRIFVALLYIWSYHSDNYFLLVPMACVFPFFHDGSYYWGRNYLDSRLYRLKWKARSTSTTAIFSLRYEDRLFWVYVGTLMFICLMIAEIYAK